MRAVTSMEAQSRFGELLDNAQREPVSITRRGREVACLISMADYRDLLARAQTATTTNDYRAAITRFRGSGKGGTTAALLADRKTDRKRDA